MSYLLMKNIIIDYTKFPGTKFPLRLPKFPPNFNETIDYAEWTTPDNRKWGKKVFFTKFKKI